MFIASSSLVALLNSVVSPPPREKESCDSKLFAGQGRREQEEQLRESLIMLWYQVLLYRKDFSGSRRLGAHVRSSR